MPNTSTDSATVSSNSSTTPGPYSTPVFVVVPTPTSSSPTSGSSVTIDAPGLSTSTSASPSAARPPLASSTLVAYSVVSSNPVTTQDGSWTTTNLSLTPAGTITVPNRTTASGTSKPDWSWLNNLSAGSGSGLGVITPDLDQNALIQELNTVNGSQPVTITSIGDQGGMGDQGGTSLAAKANSVPSIQQLPNQQSVHLDGVLNGNTSTALYAVRTDPWTDSLRLDLKLLSGPGPIFLQVDLPDGTQIGYDAIQGPGPQGFSMNVPMSRADRSGEVILKVASSLNQSGSSSSSAPLLSPESYSLDVTREQSPTTPTPLPPGSIGSGADGSSLSAPQTQSATSGTSRSTSMSPEAEQTEANLGQTSAMIAASATVSAGQQLAMNPVATGPLPERAGAPPGGILAEEDPVPQLDRHDPALVDLALIGLRSPAAEAGNADLAALADDLDRGDDTSEVNESLVALRGPGGFPLLAASLQKESAPDIDALVAALPADARSLVAVEHTPGTLPAESATDLPDAARPRIQPATSVLSGLSVALAMVFGLVLPDLTALLTVAEAPRSRLRLAPLLRRRNRA